MPTYDPEYAPSQPDPLLTHRTERTWVDVLTLGDRLRGRLIGVEVSGSIEFNVNRTIRGGGSITLLQSDTRWALDTGGNLHVNDIDWGQNRLRVWRQVGDTDPWPMGTFLPSAPTISRTGGGLSVSVEMLDKLHVLHRDGASTTYSLPAGTNVVQAIGDIISSANESDWNITDSDRTLSGDRVWEAGTTKLEIVNELLEYIGYFSLDCDGRGTYHGHPYDPPESRGIQWEFRPGEASIHSPEWDYELDLSDVPNEFITITEGTADVPSIIGRATNEDPASPTSYQARGYQWVTASDSIEADSPLEANQAAQRRLAARTARAAKVSASHAVLPLSLNDALTFESYGYGPVRATVQAMEIDLSIGGQCTSTWRIVGDIL